MRILVVSAHHPPNFVSGGTLQPQRLARALVDRGHDVSVFAGWLGDDREPLSTWVAEDDVGLPVRWVAVSSFIEWGDRANYDNPGVTDVFRRHLAAFGPDVVHVHSLQTLGAGVVEAAREAGVPTVVTMHDFWWVCARQFFTDRTMRPCCIVADAGVCPCERTHGWLAERNERLRRALGRVQQILVPSHAALRVLAANGIDPSILTVDENGLPDEQLSTRRSAAASGEVRFLYTGGPNELKGVHVVAAAAESLATRSGWSVTAVGIGAWASRNGRPLPVGVVDRSPFMPAEADDVFAAADVLLVPSIMRESHSIVTREALLRGMPVICSDCLGPEEVVEDGVNGFVVSTGDAEALALTMARFVDDPSALARLSKAAPLVGVRTLAEQVNGLERRFTDLAAAPPTGAEEPRPAVGPVLFICGIDGAPLRYRAHLPAEALRLAGIEAWVHHFLDPDLEDLVNHAATVIVYRVPANTWTSDVLDRARARGVPVWFDADDLIVDPDVADQIPALRILDPDAAELWVHGVHRYRTTLETCDGYIASTAPLARHVAALTGHAVVTFGNGVGIVLGRRSDEELRRPRSSGPLRVGYFSGTDTHDHDWAMIEPAVLQVLAERSDVELWLGGPIQTSPAVAALGDRLHRLPTVPWLKLPALLRDLDVNLAPLEPGSIFNEAKSALKWLEAALVATPTIASPTEPFREAIDHGRTGLLAAGADQWRDSLRRLLDDPVERGAMGNRARREALLAWSPHQQSRRYLELLEFMHAAPPRQPPTTSTPWTPTTVVEHPRVIDLEPYGARSESASIARIRRRARQQGRRLQRSIAEQGAPATARRAARALWRRAKRFGGERRLR